MSPAETPAGAGPSLDELRAGRAGGDRGSRPASALSLSAAGAPATLLTLLGLLWIVVGTNPIRPYAGGRWTPGDLGALVVLGALVGLLGRGLWGFTGIVLGMTGAIALQLFVLTGQASWVPEVVATVRQPSWLTAVAASLGTGLAAITGGYALTRAGLLVVRALGRRLRGQIRWRERWASRPFLAITVVLGGILLPGVLVLDASTSAYVRPATQPILHVVVRGDEIIDVEPTTIDAGRIELSATRTGVTDAGVIATVLLPSDQQAALDAGRIQYGFLGGALLPGTYPGQPPGISPDQIATSRQVEFSTPGVYGFVVSRAYTSWESTPEWDGWVPILDARTIVVEAAAPGDVRTRGDGGAVQLVGGLVAMTIAGWAAAGTVIVARRSRRSARLAPIVGFATAALLGLLALAAIDLAHNPF